MKRLLLVEDDVTLGETLKELLEADNFDVTWVKDGEKALDETFAKEYDLLLLDVKVPFINGFELLKDLRESGNSTPAIFITALTDINSLSQGFESGADDYIKKPFDFDELLIRIKALIKKSFNSHSNIIKYRNISYDIEKEEIKRDGETIHLPPFEKKLLKVFLQNIGKTISKEEIALKISEGEEISEKALRVHINKLRKAGFDIKNMRGIGYRLEEEA
ncbi:response regulator transcription factor [Nitrosophilus alvini]|uniref:response regulator transcription factor n=1 Tax=Nitrosophilus alvini TaxID=2714855 RepID=UPI00190A785C|nr:response regulator transcription factor [Nitrosophilus alvini]